MACSSVKLSGGRCTGYRTIGLLRGTLVWNGRCGWRRGSFPLARNDAAIGSTFQIIIMGSH